MTSLSFINRMQETRDTIKSDRAFFKMLLRIYVWLFWKAYGIKLNLNGGSIMKRFILKNDHPDFGFSVGVGNVTDAEGEVLPDESVNIEITSSDEDVLGLTLDETGKNGSAHVGHSGVSAFSVVAKDASGNVLASSTDEFVVTPGDPKFVDEIETVFDGVEPEAETAPAAEAESTGSTSESAGESTSEEASAGAEEAPVAEAEPAAEEATSTSSDEPGAI